MRAQRVWGSDLTAPGAVVGHLLAMQAQEHRYARWSIAQRMRGAVTADTIDRAFDDGELLRTHVLRPTWHYVRRDDLRWLLGFSGPVVSKRTVRRQAELELDARTLARAIDIVAAEVANGPRTRHELGAALERRRVSPAGQRLPHILMHAELHLVVCSGPMRAKHHTYAAFDERVTATAGPSGDEAAAELARRYFASHGPAMLQDFVWWAGLPVGRARAALDAAATHLTSSNVDDRTYWFAEAGGSRVTRPRADLVQVYDETIVAYRVSRDVVSSESSLFEQGLGFMHSVLIDGRVAGRWRVGRSGAVETRLDRPLPPAERDAVDDAVARFQAF